MAIETFKILNNMSHPVLSNLVKRRDCISYDFRYNNILQVPHIKKTYLFKYTENLTTKKNTSF